MAYVWHDLIMDDAGDTSVDSCGVHTDESTPTQREKGRARERERGGGHNQNKNTIKYLVRNKDGNWNKQARTCLFT